MADLVAVSLAVHKAEYKLFTPKLARNLQIRKMDTKPFLILTRLFCWGPENSQLIKRHFKPTELELQLGRCPKIELGESVTFMHIIA